jgi:hypothetical protein
MPPYKGFPKRHGTRAEVWAGEAWATRGAKLTKSDFKEVKGVIKSIKASQQSKANAIARHTKAGTRAAKKVKGGAFLGGETLQPPPSSLQGHADKVAHLTAKLAEMDGASGGALHASKPAGGCGCGHKKAKRASTRASSLAPKAGESAAAHVDRLADALEGAGLRIGPGIRRQLERARMHIKIEAANAQARQLANQ